MSTTIGGRTDRLATGSGEADRLDLEHGETQLLGNGGAQRPLPFTADVEVRSLSGPVRNREDIVGREEAKPVHGNRRSQRDSDDQIEGVVGTEVEP